MKKDKIKKAMQLYLVTDRHWLKAHSLYEDVEAAINGGVTCVQLREKHLNHQLFVQEAKELKELCNQNQIPLIINDNVEVMLEVDADGIHVGQSDMQAQDVRKLIGSDKVLGVSVQTVEQAITAQNAGADYLGVGAVFPTGTKDDAIEVDLATLQDICQHVDIPIVAIGGINQENLLQLKGSGIDGIAVVSAIMAAEDIIEATKQLKERTKELLL
ncbi:MAG: thiamine phosphate synthase [Longibaculum muris]|uniref:Thiamine-phosphate synthase n=1 Tax=Longibaculum muris TaxID=1796628 RepID=A0A4V2W565_9FIRM|nr:thiamine phosphate synthase [Longibaculum muris]KXU48360.1 thiamine-phosphate diphosphorylase [Candidatus Stoquefichus sp. KLE1796]MCR1887964.1 thiamine phosphate synthase [Longibaculum muris]MED9812871.1 thiamine phosphate synthase [Longibaculum muris]TCV98559.1 thiamine-phosphate pyrophosphorylase [Longibaculum muris]